MSVIAACILPFRTQPVMISSYSMLARRTSLHLMSKQMRLRSTLQHLERLIFGQTGCALKDVGKRYTVGEMAARAEYGWQYARWVPSRR